MVAVAACKLPPDNRPDQAARGQFQPGKSGNPGGRPKVLGHVRDLARAQTDTAINTLVAIMSNSKSPAAARVRAAELLLDRGWGKPEAKTEVGLPGSFEDLSDEKLKQTIFDQLVARGLPEDMARDFICGNLKENVLL